MRGRYKRKEAHGKVNGPKEKENKLLKMPLLMDPVTVSEGLNSPAPVKTLQQDSCKKGSKCSNYEGEKRYLGVRVKMPVKDMLRNIRIARGCDPQDFQQNCGKRCKGEKKRVYTSGECRANKRKLSTKSLEELAIIVEVLEEDLKTGNNNSPLPENPYPSNIALSPEYSPEPTSKPRGLDLPSYRGPPNYPESHIPRTTDHCSTGLSGPSDENKTGCIYHSLQAVVSHQHIGYNTYESDNMIPSPQSNMTYSPGTADYYQAQSPPNSQYTRQLCSPNYDLHYRRNVEGGGRDGRLEEERLNPQNQNWNQDTAAFFWTQLQREEYRLRDISDSVLLATDAQGKTALHRAVCLGKRALGYAVARRMASHNSLDLKDSEGMTALHLAAKQNQHLMVADLIYLGASVNERDGSGKTCLHLSSENGYIRVLEVLKHMMTDGVYVVVDATDKYGLSALQCAVLALDATILELERSTSPCQIRFHTLRKQQMMETMECLLEMGGYLPTLGNLHDQELVDVCTHLFH